MPRVLVTRPEPGASQTAARLEALGFIPVVLPLTRIEPLAPQTWPEVSRLGAVAISSMNAVRHAPRPLLEQIAHLPVYAVGERTGAAARHAGLAVADDRAGDAAGLVRRLADALQPGTGVLVLCGRVRRGILERGLSQAGHRPEILETYDTLALSPSPGEVDEVLGRGAIDAVLLYSAFAAREFARFMEGAPAAGLFENAAFVTMSERIAARLPVEARSHVRVAREPTEEAMLSLLQAGM